MTRKPGRPGKIEVGSTVRVRINGEGGLPLLAKVIRNSPMVMVEIVERDPVWCGAQLNPRQYKIVKKYAKALEVASE